LDYAIKWLKIEDKNKEIDLVDVQKEYFMCCLADALGVGPKMFKLFGYDIILSKKKAFFTMERCFPRILDEGG
jgi:hypothetical protein